MKRFLALAALVLGLAACQTEPEGLDVQMGGEQEVMLTVSLPETTRANSANSANGFDLNSLATTDYSLRYILEVYRVNDDAVLYDTCQRFVETSKNTSMVFPVRLAPGHDYRIVAWTDIVEGDSKEDRYYYTEEGLDNVVIMDNGTVKWNAMDETRDAYTYVKVVDNFSSASNLDMTLTRPFAKLRVVATDIDDIRKVGLVPTTTTVEYSQDMYFKYNAVADIENEGAANDARAKSHAFTYTTTATQYVDNNGEYTLFTDYIFVPSTGTAKFNLTVKGADGNIINKEIGSFNTDIFVERNKLTTIKGDVLTTGANINVDIENGGAMDGTINEIFAGSSAAAQAALDNAVANTTIHLEPGVNYGTLYVRANPGHSNTELLDIPNAYRYDYKRTIENVTIVGAAGAKVDGIEFEDGAKPGDWYVQIDVKNLVIDGVEFTDAFTSSPAGYNAPIMITTSNGVIDGLTVKNCKLIGDNEKLNLVYIYGANGNSKNISLIGNTVDGIARLCELRGTENVTIKDNTIKNTYEHAMLLSGSGYTGNVTITNNTADGIRDRFVRMSGAEAATVIITNNTILNYLGADDDYIKVTDGNNVIINGTNVTIEDNTISIGVIDTNAAQAALDNATAGDVIQLQPGVNYGTLIFRQNASSTVVDITSAGGDAAGNEKYRRIENLTIIGAEGAVVDGFDFQVGWIDGSGASFIDIENLTVKNVTFSGETTPFNFDGSKGSALGIDGLTIENCKMTDADNKNRLVFQQISGYKILNDKTTTQYVMTAGVKNLTITNCEVTGAYMVIESRAMENLIITDNTFTGIKQRDMLITSDTTNHPNETYTGEITITGNTSIAGEERFVRGSLNNSNAVVVIKDNTIKNYLGEDDDYIKVDGGNNVTIENNQFI